MGRVHWKVVDGKNLSQPQYCDYWVVVGTNKDGRVVARIACNNLCAAREAASLMNRNLFWA